MRINRQRGDTIIEVLISIVVATSVIGGAYIVSNHSLVSTRSAQEHSVALKLAEGQLEQLKGLAQDPAHSDEIFGAAVPGQFCLGIDSTTSTTAVYTATDPHCIVNSSGDAAAANEQPQFTIAITRSGNDFTLDETWDDVSGHTQDKIELNYRVYQP